MARRDFSTIFSKVAGLNNVVEDFRIPYSEEEGITTMSATANIVVDDLGGAEVRPGYLGVEAGVWESIYCDGGEMVGVKDGSLCLVDPGTPSLVLEPGFSGRVSYCMVNGEIYYTAGDKKGRVVNGAHYPWPVTSYGRETNRKFSDPMPARHIAFHLSRIWLGNGNLLAFSEPLAFSLFDLANTGTLFEAPITMLRPVDGGLYISTTKKVYFLRGRKISEIELKQVSDSPAIEGSCCHSLLPGTSLGLESEDFFAAWTSPDGVFVGDMQGKVSNITKESVIFPLDKEEYENTGASGVVSGRLFFHIGK